MAITIDIFITDQGVAAQKILDSEDRGQTVTWVFKPRLSNFQVVFKGFQPPGPLDSSLKQDIPPGKGPFSQPLVNVGGQITGIIAANARDGHHFYEITDGSKSLHWLNPLPGLGFGGLDVPKGPP